MPLSTANIQKALLKEAIIITGAPRSGTTLLGKLIGSLDRLEYQFEPPSLYMIACAFAAGEISMEIAQQLLTVHLCEDLFLESIHGRGANLRPNDDSQVLYRMDWVDLNNRWQNVRTRNDAIRWAQEKNLKLAVKMPNLFDSLPLIRETIANAKIVISIRNGVDVVRSIIRKGWVNNEGLERDLWPYSGAIGGINIPYWVPARYKETWSAMNSATRACIMWASHAECGLKADKERNTILIRYEELLAAPFDVMDRLASDLGHKTTIHTRRWIEAIREPASLKEADREIFCADVDPEVLAWFERVNASWGY